MKHFLSFNDFSPNEIARIFERARTLKATRDAPGDPQPLGGQTWAMIFSKPSTRTRVSFDVGIRELGGATIYLNAADAQLGRGELIKDTARVLARMVHGAVIRTFAQADIEEFAEFSGIPTINALTDEEHPCQIMSDIFTIEEKRGPIAGQTVAFIGDGLANTARSWALAADRLGFNLRIAAPPRYQPNESKNVICTDDPSAAARDADVLYTDIWVAMGQEGEEARRGAELGPFWINQALVRQAKPDALVMHCLPAHRGQEIEAQVFEAHAQTIFDQSENRLHVQKAILCELANGNATREI